MRMRGRKTHTPLVVLGKRRVCAAALTRAWPVATFGPLLYFSRVGLGAQTRVSPPGGSSDALEREILLCSIGVYCTKVNPFPKSQKASIPLWHTKVYPLAKHPKIHHTLQRDTVYCYRGKQTIVWLRGKQTIVWLRGKQTIVWLPATKPRAWLLERQEATRWHLCQTCALPNLPSHARCFSTTPQATAVPQQHLKPQPWLLETQEATGVASRYLGSIDVQRYIWILRAIEKH